MAAAEQIAVRLGLVLDQLGIAHAVASVYRAVGADAALIAAEARAAALAARIVEQIADPARREAAARGLLRWQ